jgi:hypothetical protein
MFRFVDGLWRQDSRFHNQVDDDASRPAELSTTGCVVNSSTSGFTRIDTHSYTLRDAFETSLSPTKLNSLPRGTTMGDVFAACGVAKAQR